MNIPATNQGFPLSGAQVVSASTIDRIELERLADDWQSTIDILARIIGVPVALIMRLTDGELEVFVASNTPNNPYEVGSKEVIAGSGLYCETVIQSNRMLKVPNALVDDDWKDNPDVALNMISYLGFPLVWPDGRPFGTICVLDRKENGYSVLYEGLIEKFKTLIERHLEIIDKSLMLKRLSELDPLTNIYNRRTFFSKADEELERAVRYNRSLSLMLFDIDHFKAINDQLGHQAGDEVLSQLATSVAGLVRSSDIVGRYGGEEFIVLFVETDLRSATMAAERIRNEVAGLVLTHRDQRIRLSVSIGICEWDGLQDMAALVSCADRALYQAKNKGRNCVCCAEAAALDHNAAPSELSLQAQSRGALTAS